MPRRNDVTGSEMLGGFLILAGAVMAVVGAYALFPWPAATFGVGLVALVVGFLGITGSKINDR